MSKLLATSWKEGQQVKRKYIKNMVIAIILLISFKKASASTRDIKMQRGIELWQVMEMAQKNNPALKGRTIEHEKSIIDVEIAKGMASPTIDLWADTTFSNYPLTVVPIRERGVFPPLNSNVTRFGVELDIPVYTGGKIKAGKKSAKKISEAAKEDFEEKKQTLLYDVVFQFSRSMYFKDMKNASKKRIAALENEEKSLQLLLKEGRISKLDLLRLQAHLSQATHDHIILDQSEKNSLSLLGTLAGSRAPITDLEPLPFGTTFVVFDTVDEREVLECSHVVRKFSLLSEASQSKFKAALSETKPKVSIFGRAIGSAGGSDFELYDDWQTGLRVMFRLWDGSVTKNKVKKSVLDIEMTKLELEEIQNQTLDKARKAEGALREASSKIKVALRQRKEAEESLRIEKLRYEAGENTINDLLSIESELWDAEANLNRSYYEKIITEASILSIFGRLTPERMRYPLNGNVNEKMSEKDEVVW